MNQSLIPPTNQSINITLRVPRLVPTTAVYLRKRIINQSINQSIHDWSRLLCTLARQTELGCILPMPPRNTCAFDIKTVLLLNGVLCNYVQVTHGTAGVCIIVHADASETGLGALLAQRSKNGKSPEQFDMIAFYSQQGKHGATPLRTKTM